jgi:hypothetical protein
MPGKDRYKCRVFLVEKSSGGYRLVTDLRHLNSYFKPVSTKFESLQHLSYCSNDVECGISVDISDAYHHLRVHEDIAKYMCFQIDNEYYQCMALPFGWNCAPYAFTKF